MKNRLKKCHKVLEDLSQEVFPDKPTTLEQWEHEYEMLDACIELKDVCIDRLKQENEGIKVEYNKLLQEIIADIPFTGLTPTTLTPLGRLKAIKQENEAYKQSEQEANEIMAELKAENDRLKSCLQEIKAIAEECTTCGDCFDCKYTEHCSTDIEAQALGVCKMILDLITKAEEE